MPTSCIETRRVRSGILRIILPAALASLQTGAALAADVYMEPQVELRTEYNTNFGLDPDNNADTDTVGALADAQVLIGVATPRGETTLRPRLKLQEYSDVGDQRVKPLEAFLDLRSLYKSQRSEFLLLGSFSRQDTYNSETRSGVFDPLDPNNGGNPDSVSTQVGETRNLFDLHPTFEYLVTERTRLGVGAQYQLARYDSDGVQSHVDYDFGQLDGFVTRELNPLSDVTLGAYVSKYEAKDDSAETDAYGANLGYRYQWSDVTGFEATVFYEQNDVTNFFPTQVDESISGWGGTLTGYRKHEVSAWRATIGRRFLPSGDGGKAEVDEFRLQYDRDLSQRLSFRGAGRYESRNAITQTGAGNDRDFARVDLSLQWFATATWYVSGGYAYIWQDREVAPDDADNNLVFLSVGYRALSPRRR